MSSRRKAKKPLAKKATGAKRRANKAAAKQAAAAAPKRLKISQALLDKLGERGRGPRMIPACDAFKIAKPPPGVVPPDAPALAFDEAGAIAWAQGAIGSMIEEGMVFLGYPMLAEFAQRPEYRRISETIATEMTRKGIELQAAGDEDKTDKLKELDDELKRLNLMGALRTAAMHDGFFGRGHLYLDLGTTDDPDELKTPLRADKTGKITKAKIAKGSLRAIKPVEPVWCYPSAYNASDPLADNWYKADTWFVMGKEIHSSRLLTFIGREVPDILKPAYSFGGLSLSQMAKPYIDNWLGTRQSISDILQAFSVMVLATNMQSVLQGSSDDSLIRRADVFNILRNNNGLMMVDKETEDFKNVSAPLGTLDALQAQSQEHICSVTGIPTMKYTGISPTGMNASSEGEIRSWYDWINAFQELLFTLNLKWILEVVQMSLWGAVDPAITFIYKPLWALDEKAQAEVDKIEAETDAILQGCEAIDSENIRKRVANKPGSAYAGLDPADLPAPLPDEETADDPDGDPDAESRPGEEGGDPPAAGAVKPKTKPDEGKPARGRAQAQG